MTVWVAAFSSPSSASTSPVSGSVTTQRNASDRGSVTEKGCPFRIYRVSGRSPVIASLQSATLTL